MTSINQIYCNTTNDVSSNPLRRGVLNTALCDKVCQ